MNTEHVKLVARRELKVRIRSRAFVVGLGVTVALIIILFSAANLLPQPLDRVGVTGTQPEGAVALLTELGGDELEVVEVTPGEVAAGVNDQLFEDLGIDALVDGNEVTVPEPNENLTSMISGAWGQARLLEQLHTSGLSQEQIAASVQPLDVIELDTTGDGVDQGTGFIVVLVLFLAVQMAGAYIMMGIMEEKGTRIVEILLTSVQARDLLLGKVVGIGALGLIQILSLLVAFVAAAAINNVDIPVLDPLTLMVGLVWFVVGYLLYGSLFAAGASLAPSQEDSQSTVAPVGVVVMISYFASILTTGSTPSTVTDLITYFPTVSPFAFPARMATGDATWWQSGLAMAIALATTAAVFGFSARVYVRSVLHTERKLGWFEALRMSD